MSKIKLNINAPIMNLTVAVVINTQQYIQSQDNKSRDHSDFIGHSVPMDESKNHCKKSDYHKAPEPETLNTATVKKSRKTITRKFTDHLNCIEEKKDGLASICEEIFNRNSIQLDYAMMIAILSENDLLRFDKLAVFCRSWYSYINETIPKRIDAIRNALDYKNSKGYFIKKKHENSDYSILKGKFKKSWEDLQKNTTKIQPEYNLTTTIEH